MDTEEKIKVKEEEKEMLLLEEQVKETIFKGKMPIGHIPTISAKVERHKEFIVDQCATPLSFGKNKRREDNFQCFLDSYLPGYEYYSYGEIIKSYLKHKVTEYVKKTLSDNIPLIKDDLNKSIEIFQEPMIMENASIFSVQSPKRIPTKIETIYRNRPMNKVSDKIKTGKISKIPLKTKQQICVPNRDSLHTQPIPCRLRKGEIKYTDLQMKTSSPPLTIGMSRAVPVKGLKVKRSLLPELCTERDTSTGIARKSVVTEIRVAAGGSTPVKFHQTKEYCFLLGYSLIGVNPYTGEQICILENVHDTDEIKSKVSSFFHDLISGTKSQKLHEPEPTPKIISNIKSEPEVPTTFLKSFSEAGTALQGKPECIKHIHTELKCKDSDITKTFMKVTHADLEDIELQGSASKISRNKASTVALASVKSSGRIDVMQSESLESDVSMYSNSTSNDIESCSSFENTPEKYISFRGDTLVYENPLTEEEFCIFKNIKDVAEIKEVVTQILMGCVCERKDAVTSFPSTKDTRASPDIVFNPKSDSEIAITKLSEHSEDVIITDIRQLKERPITNMSSVSSLTGPIEKATDVVSKLFSKNKISRSKISMSSTKARGEQLPCSKVVKSSNIFTSEPALAHILGGVQTETDTEHKNNDISAGLATYASDSLCEESDIEYSLIKETYLASNMKPLATSTPKNLLKDFRKKDEQCDFVPQNQRRRPINVLILDDNIIEEISCKIGYLTNLTAIYVSLTTFYLI